jgi:hypothetical protein
VALTAAKMSEYPRRPFCFRLAFQDKVGDDIALAARYDKTNETTKLTRLTVSTFTFTMQFSSVVYKPVRYV